MQIHELNNYGGEIGSDAYLAIDDGTDTGKVSASQLVAKTNSDIDELGSFLNARIDNIIAGGAAPSASEIIDARLGADGVTYPSLGDAIRDQVDQLRGDYNSFAEYIDGRVPNPQFELGDIYVNGSGAISYYNSTTRARTKQGTSINLQAGTIVGLSNYDGYRFLIYKSNGDNTYTNETGGWKQTDFTISTTADYLILLSYLPESTITNLTELARLLVIRYGSTFTKLLDGLETLDTVDDRVNFIETRDASVDYIKGARFELGDLYVNSSGIGSYYNSTSRLRTIKNNPLSLREGDVVGLSDYSNAVFVIRRKISDNQYATPYGTDWLSADQLIFESGEYEFLIKYPTEATITDAEALAKLFQIKNKYGIVREGSNIENLTDIFKDELQTTIDVARAKTTSRGLMFGVITDTHLDNKRVGYYNQTMENLERLNNGLQFNGIFHLGDIINGYGSAELAKEHLQYAVDRLLKIGKQNTYITVGNHDNNNGGGDSQRLTDYELYSYLQRYNEHYVVRSMSASSSVYESQTSNYYVDYPSLKIRMIMFDSCYYGGGFPDDMIPWMRELLASTPEDYHFIFFTHESTEAALNGGNALGNATAFKNLLAQYKDRIYCYIHGHTHLDYVGYTNEFAQIGLCCTVPDQPVAGSWVPEGGVQPDRAIGTVTQDCISVIIILPEEQKVELVRFGAGEDRTIPFRQA